MEMKTATVVSVRTLMRPVVRLLIRLGFGFPDFSEVVKSVYVEIASEEYGKRGRPTNMSRVAILTGLTRREVSRLRKVIEHDPLEQQDKSTSVGNVLSAWYQEAEYVDGDGKPQVLKAEGAGSFRELVEKYRGDIPATAIIGELERVGAIETHRGGVTARSRYYMPFTMDENAIIRFGRVLGDLGNTVAHNIEKGLHADAVFEGRALNEFVNPAGRDAFNNYLDRKGEEFLEDVDSWLSDHRVEAGKTGHRVGVGIYSIGSID